MKKPTTKQIAIIIGTIIIAGLLAYGACTTARAEEAQQPPAKGEWFVAASLLYTADWGGAIGAGYQFKESGVIILPQIAYTYAPETNGVVEYQPFRCAPTYTVPYHVGEVGTLGGMITVAIPLRKSTKK